MRSDAPVWLAPLTSGVPAMVPRGIGRYTIEQRLGRGAMGIVYAAYDPALERRVALKVLRPLVKDIRDVEIPALEGAQEASGVITASEAIAYHDRYRAADVVLNQPA